MFGKTLNKKAASPGGLAFSCLCDIDYIFLSAIHKPIGAIESRVVVAGSFGLRARKSAIVQ